jgi:hypothetical protein
LGYEMPTSNASRMHCIRLLRSPVPPFPGDENLFPPLNTVRVDTITEKSIQRLLRFIVNAVYNTYINQFFWYKETIEH